MRPAQASVAPFLQGLAALPVRDWLAVRDAVQARDHGPAFAAYEAASALAAGRGLAPEVRALAGEVRRLTDAIAWFAKFRPDGHAITRRDVGALQLLAEWAAVGLLVRDALPRDVFAALYAPFAGVLPVESLGATG